MNLEELLEWIDSLSETERTTIRATIDTKLERQVTDEGPSKGWVENLSATDKAAIQLAVQDAIIAGDIRLPRESQELDPAIDQGVARNAQTVVQAYQVATGVQVPAAFLSQLDAARTQDDIRQVMLGMQEADGGQDRIFRAFTEITRGTIEPLDPEAQLLTPIEGNPGKFVDEATGEIVDAPIGARSQSSADVIDGGIPPPPDSQLPERQYLGIPPPLEAEEGTFVPGLGIDPTQRRIDEALARVNKTNRLHFMDQIGGGLSLADIGRGDVPVLENQFYEEDLQLRYFVGDEWRFSLDSAGRIRSLQDQLSRGGLLKPGAYVPGLWDKSSVGAMQLIMAEANATGVTWEMSLANRHRLIDPELLGEIYGTGRSATSSRAPFISPTYRAPDNASLSQAVKELVRQRLRREPTSRDMAELTTQMDGDYRKAYDVEVAALRSEYNATTRAIDTEESQSGGTVRTVDPSARFREAFEERFAGEISLNEDSDDFIEQTAKMQGAMGRLDQMIGF